MCCWLYCSPEGDSRDLALIRCEVIYLIPLSVTRSYLPPSSPTPGSLLPRDLRCVVDPSGHPTTFATRHLASSCYRSVPSLPWSSLRGSISTIPSLYWWPPSTPSYPSSIYPPSYMGPLRTASLPCPSTTASYPCLCPLDDPLTASTLARTVCLPSDVMCRRE